MFETAFASVVAALIFGMLSESLPPRAGLKMEFGHSEPVLSQLRFLIPSIVALDGKG
jgi:hypothetical protein